MHDRSQSQAVIHPEAWRGSWTDASGTYRFRRQLDGSVRFWKYDGKQWRPRKTVPIDVVTLLGWYDAS
jgi:hypothetical protein